MFFSTAHLFLAYLYLSSRRCCVLVINFEFNGVNCDFMHKKYGQNVTLLGNVIRFNFSGIFSLKFIFAFEHVLTVLMFILIFWPHESPTRLIYSYSLASLKENLLTCGRECI